MIKTLNIKIKKNRPIIIFICVSLITLLAVMGGVYIYSNRAGVSSQPTAMLYFLNPATNKLEIETRNITATENKDIAEQVLNMFLEGPQSKGLIIPANVGIELVTDSNELTNTSTGETTLKLDFTSEYYEMAPLQEMFFRSALVCTIMELSFVNNVLISVEGNELLNSMGQPMGYQNRSNVNINPKIESARERRQVFMLYYADSEMQGLIPEARWIRYNPDEPVEKYIVESLIAGPTAEGNYAAIPSETIIREVKTDANICYVNLSSEFLSKHNSANVPDRLMIYSIVNTLTQLSKIEKVQFLVEYKMVDKPLGTLDISKPLERDVDLIIDYEQE